MFRTTLAGLCIVAITATTSTAFGQSGTRGGGGGTFGSGSRSYAPTPSYNAPAYSSPSYSTRSYGAQPSYSGTSSYNDGSTCSGGRCAIQSHRQAMYAAPVYQSAPVYQAAPVYHSSGQSSCGSYQPASSCSGSSSGSSFPSYAPPAQFNGNSGGGGSGTYGGSSTYQPDHSSMRIQSPSSSAPQPIYYNAPPIPDSSASLNRPVQQRMIRKASYQPAVPGGKAFVLDTDPSTRRSIQ